MCVDDGDDRAYIHGELDVHRFGDRNYDGDKLIDSHIFANFDVNVYLEFDVVSEFHWLSFIVTYILP